MPIPSLSRSFHYRADPDDALSSILEAERIAPQKTRINPATREVVSHLLRFRRKSDLVELALRMGVASAVGRRRFRLIARDCGCQHDPNLVTGSHRDVS